MGQGQSTDEDDGGAGKVYDTAQIFFDDDGNLRLGNSSVNSSPINHETRLERQYI